MNRLLPALTIMVAGLINFSAHAQHSDEELPSIDAILNDAPSHEDLFQDYPSMAEFTAMITHALPENLQEDPNWVNQKRLAALLPILRVGLADKEGNIDRTRFERDPSRKNRVYGIDDNDDIHTYEDVVISMSWDLSEFIFHGDFISSANTQMDLADYKTRFEEKAINTYVELKTTKARLAQDRSLALKERLKLEFTSEGLAALLDIYTNKRFSKHIALHKKTRLKSKDAPVIETPAEQPEKSTPPVKKTQSRRQFIPLTFPGSIEHSPVQLGMMPESPSPKPLHRFLGAMAGLFNRDRPAASASEGETMASRKKMVVSGGPYLTPGEVVPSMHLVHIEPAW